jgi:hypothetical protein
MSCEARGEALGTGNVGGEGKVEPPGTCTWLPEMRTCAKARWCLGSHKSCILPQGEEG